MCSTCKAFVLVVGFLRRLVVSLADGVILLTTGLDGTASTTERLADMLASVLHAAMPTARLTARSCGYASACFAMIRQLPPACI